MQNGLGGLYLPCTLDANFDGESTTGFFRILDIWLKCQHGILSESANTVDVIRQSSTNFWFS